jgi:hypothetical protein
MQQTLFHREICVYIMHGLIYKDIVPDQINLMT